MKKIFIITTIVALSGITACTRNQDQDRVNQSGVNAPAQPAIPPNQGTSGSGEYNNSGTPNGGSATSSNPSPSSEDMNTGTSGSGSSDTSKKKSKDKSGSPDSTSPSSSPSTGSKGAGGSSD